MAAWNCASSLLLRQQLQGPFSVGKRERVERDQHLCIAQGLLSRVTEQIEDSGLRQVTAHAHISAGGVAWAKLDGSHTLSELCQLGSVNKLLNCSRSSFTDKTETRDWHPAQSSLEQCKPQQNEQCKPQQTEHASHSRLSMQVTADCV